MSDFGARLADTWHISSKKQENGLWGLPLQCVSIDKIIHHESNEINILHSAICIAIAERYAEPFEIFMSTSVGFLIKLIESNSMLRIRYADYVLNGNSITWIGSKKSNSNQP